MDAPLLAPLLPFFFFLLLFFPAGAASLPPGDIVVSVFAAGVFP